MKVLILCHEDLIPNVGWQKLKSSVIENLNCRTEVFCGQALRKLGHKVKYVGISDTLLKLRQEIEAFRPEVTLNLLEEFDGEALLEPFVVDYLKKFKIKISGGSSESLLIAKNKIAAKALLEAKKVRVPGRGRWPQIVKYISEDASLGISDNNVVKSSAQRQKAIVRLMNIIDSPIFFEEYIDGRELFCSIFVAQNGIVTSPLFEIDFGQKKGPRILNEKLKWNFSYREKLGVKVKAAEDLSRGILNETSKFVKSSIEALKLRGAVRIDFRLNKKNKLFVLEVNPNPDLAKYDEYATSMKLRGFSYLQLMQMIVTNRVPKDLLVDNRSANR